MARPFLGAVAEASATPGGGSAAAFAGALAASLGQMVAGLSRNKKSQAAYVEQLSDALAELEAAARELAAAIDHDAASYDGVVAAYRLPKSSAEEQQERAVAIDRATRHAAEVPLGVAERALAVLDRLRRLEPIASAAMRSDLVTARWLAVAAARGAMENVAINLESLADAVYVAEMKQKLALLEDRLAGAPAAAAP